MSSKLQNAALVIALSATLSACPGTGTNPTGSAPPSAASPTIPLEVEVRAAPGAPDDYGMVPGGAIAGARVEVELTTSSDNTSHIAMTDESGRVVVMVQSGSYRIIATKDTHDPKCRWHGITEIEVPGGPVTVELFDLWVQCE